MVHPRTGLVPCALALALILTGCTSAPPPPTPPPRPADAFAALPDRPSAQEASFGSLATDATRLVSAGSVNGAATRTVFRYSDDAGATWQEGELSAAARDASNPGETVQQVAHGPGGTGAPWLAVGTGPTGPLAWTSPDGAVWERTPLTSGIPATATARVLEWTGSGWLLFTSEAGEQLADAPLTAWTSSDGLTWVPGSTLTDGRVEAVAVHDGLLVAAGSGSRPRAGDLPRVWLSEDAGATWRTVEVPVSEAGRYGAGLWSITWAGSQFVAGGWSSDPDPETAKPLVMTSADGSTWSHAATAPLPGSQANAVGMVPITGGVVAAVRRFVDGHPTVMMLRRSGGITWSHAQVEGAAAHGQTGVTDLLRVGDVIVASVRVGAAGGELWRSEDDGRTYTATRPEAPGEPVVAPRALTPRAAYGQSDGVDVVWPRQPDGTFGAPQVIDDDPATEVEGAAPGAEQDIVWGRHDVDQRSDAQVWLPADSGFEALPVDALHASGPTAVGEVSDIAWTGQGWLAAGAHSENGTGTTSALLDTSADGRAWERGAAAGGAPAGAPTNVDAVRGTWDGWRRGATAATGAGDLLVATGSAEEHGAVAWLQAGRGTWRQVPLPSDGVTGRPSALALAGDTVVAAGAVRVGPAGERRAVAWASADRGETWQRATFLDREASALELVALGETFVAAVQRADGSGIDVLTSADGLAWTARTAVEQEPGGTTGTQIRLLAASVTADGSGVDLVVRHTTRDDTWVAVTRAAVG